MKEFNATNTGNKIIINCATWEEVTKLKRAIIKELEKSPIGLKIIGKNKNLLDNEIDISGVIDFIKNSLFGLECSEDFETALFECLKHCTYKNVYKIDKSLFEADKCPDAREDYYEIAISCIEENLRPFLKSLISMLKTRLGNHLNIQALEQLFVKTNI